MTHTPPTPDDSESGVSSEELSAPVPVLSELVIPPEEALTALAGDNVPIMLAA